MARSKLHPLTAYRALHDLTLDGVAKKLGVTPVTIWRWESGQRTPRARHLPALSKLTGASISVLMGLEIPRNRRRRKYGEAERVEK